LSFRNAETTLAAMSATVKTSYVI